jgi:hypothetical protein
MNTMKTGEGCAELPTRPRARPFGLLMLLGALLLWALPASAQRVDCGNGKWCPKGNACLLDGMCGRQIDRPPGAVTLSNGGFCDPGHHENRYRPGSCTPPGYVDCPSGLICPPQYQCSADGLRCEGGPPATGPMCGGGQCAEGRICASTGRCMNPAIFKDCGNGTICSIHAACETPKGCAYVAPERTRQQP